MIDGRAGSMDNVIQREVRKKTYFVDIYEYFLSRSSIFLYPLINWVDVYRSEAGCSSNYLQHSNRCSRAVCAYIK